MALTPQGKYRFGDGRGDIAAELARYARKFGHPTGHAAEATCRCGRSVFRLHVVDDAVAAVRHCIACGVDHPIGDSSESLADADLGPRECPCGGGDFEVAAAVALDEDRVEARWFYVGARCVACGLVACYGDWKVGGGDYRELLAGT